MVRTVRLAVALVLALAVGQAIFAHLAGDSGWRMVAALLAGGMFGAVAFTAVHDGPSALWRALRHGGGRRITPSERER